MNPARRGLAAVCIGTMALWFCQATRAQQPSAAADLHTPTPSPASSTTQTPSSTSGRSPVQEAEYGQWHFALTPYLWFAGAHGTVGALGRNVSMHASPGDLLSHFDIGVMGAAEFWYKHFLLNGDLMWIRLSDDKALPFPNLGAVSANATVGQLVWTSKVGYRLINKKLKADANVGARYWHLGQKLNFNPSALGLNLNTSQNWADIVVGGRVQLPLGEKAVIDLAGDVGGWNATAKLDYQFAPLLGLNVAPEWTLWAGYRYLFVDYRPSNLSVYNMVTSGAILGVTYKFR